MLNFTDKIKQFASKRNWQAEKMSESSCNIQFTFSNQPFSDMLTFVRVINQNSFIQFMLTPGAFSVSDMSRFSHDLSNMLLHRNSTSKGFWCIPEMKTPVGAKYFPSYIRIIHENSFDVNTFNEIMDDTISEFKHLN